jgi:hypothetical protein
MLKENMVWCNLQYENTQMKLKTLKNGQRIIILKLKKSKEKNHLKKTWIGQRKALQLNK